jgi:hypothetical protein
MNSPEQLSDERYIPLITVSTTTTTTTTTTEKPFSEPQKPLDVKLYEFEKHNVYELPTNYANISDDVATQPTIPFKAPHILTHIDDASEEPQESEKANHTHIQPTLNDLNVYHNIESYANIDSNDAERDYHEHKDVDDYDG